MFNARDLFEELRKKGYRITPQREKILEVFFELPEGNHLSAESLHLKLKEKNIKISLATLYRTLKFLYVNGLLRELDFGEDHKHYELGNLNINHHHLICNNCGLTIEFSDNSLLELSKNIAIRQNEFEVQDYQFKIFGLCKSCKDYMK